MGEGDTPPEKAKFPGFRDLIPCIHLGAGQDLLIHPCRVDYTLFCIMEAFVRGEGLLMYLWGVSYLLASLLNCHIQLLDNACY